MSTTSDSRPSSWPQPWAMPARVPEPEEVAGVALADFGAAVLSGDVEGLVAQFCADGDPVYAGSEVGEVAVGQVALHELFTDLANRDERYSFHTECLLVVPATSGIVVLAEGRLGVHPRRDDGSFGPAAEELAYRSSGLLEEGPDGWRWRCFQGTEPVAPPA